MLNYHNGVYGNFIFLAHIPPKRTFKEFYSAIYGEIVSRGIDFDFKLQLFYDKPHELRRDKNKIPHMYSPTLSCFKIVGDESIDFSYFVNKERKIIKQRRRYFYDITYDDFK